MSLKEQGMTQQAIADELDISRGKVYRILRAEREKENIKFEDMLFYDDADVDNFLDTMKLLQKSQKKLSTKQTSTTISIDDNKPIGIAHTGDWHLGHKGVDYERFDLDMNLLENTEGMYAFLLGDYAERAIKHKGSHFGELVSPGMQDRLVLRQMERLRRKALAIVRGCHDAWEEALTDNDFMEEICLRANAVNLWHGGKVTLKLGNQEYLWRLRHKYPYESSLNPGNSMRRLMERQGPCDVAAGAHKHEHYFFHGQIMEELRVLLRPGSYKIWDDFAQQLGGWEAKPIMPVVIIFPDKKELLPVPDIRQAVPILEGLRR